MRGDDEGMGYSDPRFRLGQAVLRDGVRCVVWELGPSDRTYWVITPERIPTLATEAELRPAEPVIYEP